MSISPMGGFYPPAYNPSIPYQSAIQSNPKPTYAQQLVTAQIKPTDLGTSKDVSVKKFAGLGAGLATVLGSYRFLSVHATESPVLAAIGTLAGLLIGGAVNGSLLGWLYNKTQKKGE